MRCPGLETIARLSEGRLPAPERARLLEHLADCDECRQVSVAMGTGDKATTRRISRPANRFPWAVVGSMAAAGLLAFALWRTHSGGAPEPTPRPEKESASSTEPVQPVEPVTAKEPKPAPPKPEPPKPEPVKPEPPKPEPETPEPPKPEPPKPGPKPPPDRTEPPKPDPVKPPAKVRDASALASVRVLDVTGEIAASKKRVLNAAVLHDTLTATTNAAFRVDGDLVQLKKGTVAALGRDADTLCLFVHSGEALVESSGASWRFADDATTLTGAALVTATGVVPASEIEPKRLGPFAVFRPRQKTWLYEDFAGEPAGFVSGEAEGGVFGTWASLPRPAPWSRRISIRMRVRTNASSMQIGMRFDGRDPDLPWAAIVSVKKGSWQEIVVNGKQFEGGPSGAKEPQAGASLVELGFSIDPSLMGGKAEPTLEIDDVVLTDPDSEGEKK